VVAPLLRGIRNAPSPVDDEALVHVFRPQDAAIGAKRRGDHERIKNCTSITLARPQRLHVRIDVDGQDGFTESADSGERLSHLGPIHAELASCNIGEFIKPLHADATTVRE